VHRRRADLVITAAVAVLAGAAAVLGAPVAVMTILGLTLIAAPGYLLEQLLFGSRGKDLERLAAATGLALGVPVIGGLLLYAAGQPLHRTAWLSLLAGVTLACDLVLLWRRRGARAWTADEWPSRQRPSGQDHGGLRIPHRRVVAFGAAAVIAVGAVGLARAGVAMQHHPGYTQLWIDRPERGAPTVDLGVSNYEGKTMQYRLVLTDHGRRAATWNVVLANGQTWRRSPRYPARYAISASLFRLPGDTRPYRHVALGTEGTKPS
jgi:Protein of unknown function (DUF1616)